MQQLTFERASKIVAYDRESGVFRWLHDVRSGFKNSVLMRRAGAIAGTRRKDGRLVIRLDGRLYLGYRVAWLLETGRWPEDEIDHMDGDATNDRFSNLRAVCRGVNQQNMRAAQRNKVSCRLLGVYANPRNAKSPWKAGITVNGKQMYLGVFATPEEAHVAYLAAKRNLHEGCTL